MAIKLNIEITSPMDARDHELLSGIAVMTLAIANHELAEQRFPEAFDPDKIEEAAASDPALGVPSRGRSAGAEPQPCGTVSEDGNLICVAAAAHRGRHTFRAFDPRTAMPN